jgi:hypothetical protein
MLHKTNGTTKKVSIYGDISRKPFFSTSPLSTTCYFLLHFLLHIFNIKNNNLGLPSKFNFLLFWWTIESKSQPRGRQLNYSQDIECENNIVYSHAS